MKNNSLKEMLLYSKKLSALYVRNDFLPRDDLKEIFEKLFHTVYIVKEPDKCVEICDKELIDIVIVGVQKSGENRLEIARNIRSYNFNIPIVVTTKSMDNDFFLECAEIGIDAYLVEPIEEINVVHMLNRIIKNIKAMKILSLESRYFKVLTQASIVSKSDIHGKITYVNNNLCNISGYTRQELIGKSHNIFKHPSTKKSTYQDMWNTILTGKIWRGRIENLNKNRNSFLAETIIIPMKDYKGKIFEFIAIRQDITEYVLLKRKMQIETLKKAEQQRINEAKEAFLVLFTHELKTPLNAIINFSKYIYAKLINSQYLEPKKTAKLLKSITSNAHDMLDNVNNILDVSKLQSHRLNYSKKLFKLNGLVLSLLEQFDSLIKAKNIKIELLLDAEHEIYSDEYRVKQIISNILSNAIKYGDTKIYIETKESKTGHVIYIEDNGNGIKDKESVFDLYEQGNVSLMKRETQGTGIGLYFVKLICTDLGIKYTLKDSARLGGTSFGLIFDLNHKNKD